MSMAMSLSQDCGPLIDRARMSNICSGVSWLSIVGDAVVTGVPKLPSRSSVQPERKKLRQVAHSAP